MVSAFTSVCCIKAHNMFDHVWFVFDTLWINVSTISAVEAVGDELLVRQVDSVISADAEKYK